MSVTKGFYNVKNQTLDQKSQNKLTHTKKKKGVKYADFFFYDHDFISEINQMVNEKQLIKGALVIS